MARLSRSYALTVSETTNSLRFGDLIEVGLLDASESTGRLERAHARFDTPVRSVGYFLGVKGRRTKHVAIAKEIIDNAKAYHYNVTPIGMIENIIVLAGDRLGPETKRVLKKLVHLSMRKLRGRDGWVYAERENKKRPSLGRFGSKRELVKSSNVLRFHQAKSLFWACALPSPP